MKKLIISTALILLLTSSAYSQGDKIRSLKVSYLTEQLNLDPQTAERFWPIYRQYEDELRSVVQEKKMNKDDTRSSYEILNQEQKALDIKRKYNTLFSKVLTGNQVSQLYQSEKEFRQMVINRSQNNAPRQNTNYKSNSRDEQINNRQEYNHSSSPRSNPNSRAIQNNAPSQSPLRSINRNGNSNNRGTINRDNK